MTSTMNNGSTQRKQLSGQLDRLDQILDGLADALNESVASAVRDVVGEVVRESVEATTREVLGNPDLLQAALAKHNPPGPQTSPVPKRRRLKELLQSACNPACDTVKQAASAATSKLREAGTVACAVGKQIGKCSANAPGILSAVARKVWNNRKVCAGAAAVGVVCGVPCYFAGPVIASIASGLSGAATTLGATFLLPLRQLLVGKTAIA